VEKTLPYFPQLKDKKVLLVSHNLTVTGAPLLLVNTGKQMAMSGAQVKLVNLGAKEAQFPLSGIDDVTVIELDHSFDFAADADLIIANTAVANTWVDTFVDRNSNLAHKIIWWLHEVDMETYGREMESLPLVGAAVFDSDCCLRLWQQTGLTPELAQTIYPGISENFLKAAIRSTKRSWWHKIPGFNNRDTERNLMRGALGVDEKDFLIITVGQYCELKGQDLLVNAVGRLLDETPELPLKLLLVGFADDREKEKFLAQLSPSESRAVDPVRVINRVKNTKLYYFAADAFVLNTQPPGETFGLVSLEAMAFGLPTLRTEGGGTREVLIDRVTGLIHPPGEAGQTVLMANIRRLMDDRQLAKKLGDAGLKRVMNDFREERFYRELSELIN
jgi:glycosyltransferase involved in cell wall biosynthesis